MDVPLWVAFVGGAAMVIAGTITAYTSFRTALLNQKSQRESANASADADRHKVDAEEMRLFRKDLQDQVTGMRHELDSVRQELREAQSQITKQNGMFVSVLYRLEGIMALKDIAKIEYEVKNLVESVRQFLDVVPMGGLEKHERKNLMLEDN